MSIVKYLMWSMRGARQNKIKDASAFGNGVIKLVWDQSNKVTVLSISRVLFMLESG